MPLSHCRNCSKFRLLKYRALSFISALSHLFILDFHSSWQIFLAHSGCQQEMDIFWFECYLKNSLLLCRCHFLCAYPWDLVIKCVPSSPHQPATHCLGGLPFYCFTAHEWHCSCKTWMSINIKVRIQSNILFINLFIFFHPLHMVWGRISGIKQ